MNDFVAAFADPDAVARYAEGPPRVIPGFADLHRMVGILLSERTPADGRVLVLGAGGGLELKALGGMSPGWHFDGIDPSDEMLKLAARTVGPLADRVRLHRGYIDDAPDGPFDAAVCLLTLHFLPRDERQRTVAEVRRRLRPGAPFVVAHLSFPQAADDRAAWLARYAAFAVTSGLDPQKAAQMQATVGRELELLSPEDDEALLRQAGFRDVELFFAAFTWRGWVAYA